MTRSRRNERGFSLIEAIVIVTITALLALILLPLIPGTARRNFAMAERGLAAAEATNAEREFRTLIRALSARSIAEASSPVLFSDARTATLLPNVPAPASCAIAGAPSVRLVIEAGRLECRGVGLSRTLLRWPVEASAAFSYSADGVAWSPNWNTQEVAPFVRFELSGGGASLIWIERAGGSP